MTRHAGFTLMELLCCVCIVAVLAACAVPTHLNAVKRTRRTDARTALLQLASLQERYYFQHARYAASLLELGDAGLARSGEGFYRLSIEARSAGQGYLAVAMPTPDGPQIQDRECQSFSLDEAGCRSASGSADAIRRCW